MSNCRWKLKLDRYPLFKTRGQTGRAFCFVQPGPPVAVAASLREARPLTQTQGGGYSYLTTRNCIESIDSRPILTSLIITMRSPGLAHLFLRKIFSAAEIALSWPAAKLTR